MFMIHKPNTQYIINAKTIELPSNVKPELFKIVVMRANSKKLLLKNKL